MGTGFKLDEFLAIESTSLDGLIQRCHHNSHNILYFLSYLLKGQIHSVIQFSKKTKVLENATFASHLFAKFGFQVASITGCNTMEKPPYMRGCKLPSCAATHLWSIEPWGECVWEGWVGKKLKNHCPSLGAVGRGSRRAESSVWTSMVGR